MNDGNSSTYTPKTIKPFSKRLVAYIFLSVVDICKFIRYKTALLTIVEITWSAIKTYHTIDIALTAHVLTCPNFVIVHGVLTLVWRGTMHHAIEISVIIII